MAHKTFLSVTLWYQVPCIYLVCAMIMLQFALLINVLRNY